MLEMEDLQIRGDLSVEFQPVDLGDTQTRQLIGKSISLVQVIWDKRTCDFTWEFEEDVKKAYPHLFSGKSQIFESKIFIVGENVIPLLFSPSLLIFIYRTPHKLNILLSSLISLTLSNQRT